MQKWEYRSIQFISIETLNELGEEGWELVFVDAAQVAYLKRPKS